MGVRAVTLRVACPAGEAVHETLRGAACRCRILHETIREGDNQTSLKAFCTSAPGDPTPSQHPDRAPTSYVDCPVWQAARRAEAEGGAHGLRRLDSDITEHLARAEL